MESRSIAKSDQTSPTINEKLMYPVALNKLWGNGKHNRGLNTKTNNKRVQFMHIKRRLIKWVGKVIPWSLTSPNDNPLDNCINLERITVGRVTAPSIIPDEAPGLKVSD